MMTERKRDDKDEEKKKGAKGDGVAHSHLEPGRDPGDFSNFPEITEKSSSDLIKRGIVALFPI